MQMPARAAPFAEGREPTTCGCRRSRGRQPALRTPSPPSAPQPTATTQITLLDAWIPVGDWRLVKPVFRILDVYFTELQPTIRSNVQSCACQGRKGRLRSKDCFFMILENPYYNSRFVTFSRCCVASGALARPPVVVFLRDRPI